LAIDDSATQPKKVFALVTVATFVLLLTVAEECSPLEQLPESAAV